MAELGASVQDAGGGQAPLGIAAFFGNIEAIKALAELGADVNAADVQGRTPLGRAAYFNHIEAIDELTALGATERGIIRLGGIDPTVTMTAPAAKETETPNE